jgi:hypothetical protein
MILTCTRPILLGHAVELAMPNHLPTTTARSKPKPRLAQHRLHQLRAPGADSGRRRAGHGHSGRPRRPRPSQPYGCLPTSRSRTSLRPDTAHAATHRHRTPTPDAGQRTADSGHLDPQMPAPDTGQRSRGQASVDTGRTHWTPHWTPDAGRGRGQGDEGAAGIRTSWATMPSDRTLDAQPCSCGRRLRRSTAHAGSAVRPPSSAR